MAKRIVTETDIYKASERGEAISAPPENVWLPRRRVTEPMNLVFALSKMRQEPMNRQARLSRKRLQESFPQKKRKLLARSSR